MNQQTNIEQGINELVQACHGASKDAGWWVHQATGTDLTGVIMATPHTIIEQPLVDRMGKALVAEKLCLIHSEISEAMEGHRKGLQDDKLPHRSMLEVELADAMIRIADLSGAMQLDLGGAIAEKLAYNATRAHSRLARLLGHGPPLRRTDRTRPPLHHRLRRTRPAAGARGRSGCRGQGRKTGEKAPTR